MKLPEDVIISQDKLQNYLLVFKEKNDKSRYLAQVGFTQENSDILEEAIRRLIREYEAIQDREDEYGIFYRVTGTLHGVTGELDIITVWIHAHQDNSYRFVTLKPNKE